VSIKQIWYRSNRYGIDQTDVSSREIDISRSVFPLCCAYELITEDELITEEMNNIEHRINHRRDTEHRHIIHYIRDIKRTNPVICRILDDEGRDQAQN
jgi:hypothetical protein